MTSDPVAEGSVRLGRTSDTDDMAHVQLAAWRAADDAVLPAAELDPAAIAAAWGQAILDPPPGSHRVLVALAGRQLVGFAATAPAADPDTSPTRDGELVALVVHPDHQREGHGSRLLHAAVDYWRDDGFTTGIAWIPLADEPRRQFLVSAGWGPDGALREVADETGTTVRLARLVTTWAD